MGIKPLSATLALLLLVSGVDTDAAAPARVFSQVGMAVGADGKTLPPVVLDPENIGGLVERQFDLGRQRRLVVRTNLSAERRDDLADVAAAVRRCHDFVEAETGRLVQGDMLLYLLAFSAVPRAYSFRVELETCGRWSQVRLALLDENQTLIGAAAAPHLRQLLYGTLPHELGHQLIQAQPTVSHDIDGHPSHHTRWFTEGVCESLALGFARRECPAHARRLLCDRRVDRVLDSTAVRERLLCWSQADRLSWEMESDLYGGALLMVLTWLERVPLRILLTELASAGGRIDGATLLVRLGDTFDKTPDEVLESAAVHGRRMLASAYSSR